MTIGNKKLQKLFDTLREEVAACPGCGKIEPDKKTDLPGHYLVSLAGQVALCSDKEILLLCQTEVWPAIRKKIKKPKEYVSGLTFTPVRELTSKHCLQNALAEAAHSVSEEPEQELDPNVISILASRLDTGYFLAGLEALWPERAELLVTSIWNTCRLRDWDCELRMHINELKAYAGEVRWMFAQVPSCLDDKRFGILLDIARSDMRSS